jgi:hypothetical protein
MLTSIATRRRRPAAENARVQVCHVADIVDAHHGVGVIGQRHEPRDLRGTDDLVGDHDLADPGRRHDFGFAELGARDADRTGRDLQLRDLRRLVRLGMRPPGHAVRTARVHDPPDVPRHDIEVDQQRGRVQRGDGLADEALRCRVSARWS